MADLIEISIPFSGSVEHVEINEWLVEEGAEVREGDPLADVSTDKVDTELESPHAGTLVRFLVQAGTEVEVGTTVALLAPPEATPEEIESGLASYSAAGR
jgi:2-oxoglutarate dehydrogenase E2 component (dihydrolipoamide succinyltransferase)